MNLPHARRADIIVEELSEETLIYDLLTHRAHSLNPTAAIVWRCCDGRTDTGDIAGALSARFGTPIGEEVVQLALRRLDSAGLLVNFAPPTSTIDRRQVLKKLALAGSLTFALPAIHSIVAPTPAQAQTCINQGGLPPGGGCVSDAQCCSNNCDENTLRCL